MAAGVRVLSGALRFASPLRRQKKSARMEPVFL